MRHLIALIFSLFPLSVFAQGTAAQYAESKYFTYSCHDAACGAPDASLIALLKEFDRAWEWLGSRGFNTSRSYLEKRNGKYHISMVWGRDACSTRSGSFDTLGCVQRLPIDRIVTLNVSYVGLKAGELTPDIIAHELAHTLQNPVDYNQENFLWFDEAVATAVGFAYGAERGSRWSFDAPLFAPQLASGFAARDVLRLKMNDVLQALEPAGDKATSDGYGRAYYLLFLGQQLKSKSDVAYLKDHLISLHGHLDGLEGLYKKLPASHSFGKIFPKFIAMLNAPRAMKSGRHWYGRLSLPEDTAFKISADPQTETITREVPQYAAEPFHIVKKLEAPESGRPELGFGILTLRIPEDSRYDGTHFAFEHELLDKSAEVRQITYADGTTQDLGFVRVIQAPARFSESLPVLKASIELVYRSVDTQLGGCVQVGDRVAVFSDPDVEAIGGFTLSTDNGTAEGRFVIPSKPGKMSVTVSLESPLTRIGNSVRRQKPAARTIPLGPFEVNGEGCMIRLNFPDNGGYATYNPKGGYTEFTSPDGEKVYFREGDVAIYAPGAGWFDMPPQVKAMMAAEAVEMQAAMVGLSPEEISEEKKQIHMPYMFASALSKSALDQSDKVLNSSEIKTKSTTIKNTEKGKVRTPTKSVPCPDGSQGCSTGKVQFFGKAMVDVVHDQFGRAVEVEFGGAASFTLAYGSFPIGIPPGW